MSLDVTLTMLREFDVYSSNITHNLNEMAEAAGIYQHLWQPEEIGITYAKQLIEPLESGLAKLKENPEKFRKHNAPNGWGKYEDFLPWLESYIQACKIHPDAEVSVYK